MEKPLNKIPLLAVKISGVKKGRELYSLRGAVIFSNFIPKGWTGRGDINMPNLSPA